MKQSAGCIPLPFKWWSTCKVQFLFSITTMHVTLLHSRQTLVLLRAVIAHSLVLPLRSEPALTNEQGVACDASAGTFTLTFDGAETDGISFDADEPTIKAALEEISTISEVVVTFLADVTQACQASPASLGFEVEFVEVANYRGDVPLMTSNIDNLEVLYQTRTRTICHLTQGRA